ncbi:hypothetical protein IWQ62_002859 [Dispira parvispora]|uniref:CNNM transmembrane domain-containing protein n=1 Tax=Dispira parvispora TaxID=1520584 RepID=A0A9W8ARZ0_9FUNG|nr:hypothetical protein IWQ62_002859 [Dispira parvispora]
MVGPIRKPGHVLAVLLCVGALHGWVQVAATGDDSAGLVPRYSQSELCQALHSNAEEPSVPMNSTDFWLRLIAVVFLVLFGGLVAGLTLGLMSIDETNLHILSISGDERQKRYAARIQPIRKNGHWLLVTLLLTNTLVNESLPIIMDSIFGGGVTAILASTALILVFGEVIPQSVCARHGLMIGAFFAWPVRILQWMLSPLGYPMACFLDWILGKNHGMIYRKAELKELVSMHDASHGGSLTHDEITIIRGVLELSEKLVKDVMTNLQSMFMLDVDSILDRSKMTEIVHAGHSRVPVYQGSRDNVVGVLLVKALILVDPDDCIPLRKLKINHIPSVTTKTSLFDILNIFQEGGSHMALVYEEENPAGWSGVPAVVIHGTSDSMDSINSVDNPAASSPASRLLTSEQSSPAKDQKRRRLLGAITLEDVIEELIQEEIIDETDVFIDMQKKIRVAGAIGHVSLDKLVPLNQSKTSLKGKGLVSGVIPAAALARILPSVEERISVSSPGVTADNPPASPTGLLPKGNSSAIRVYDSCSPTTNGSTTQRKSLAINGDSQVSDGGIEGTGVFSYIHRHRSEGHYAPISRKLSRSGRSTIRKGTAFSSRRREQAHNEARTTPASPKFPLNRPVSDYSTDYTTTQLSQDHTTNGKQHDPVMVPEQLRGYDSSCAGSPTYLSRSSPPLTNHREDLISMDLPDPQNSPSATIQQSSQKAPELDQDTSNGSN